MKVEELRIGNFVTINNPEHWDKLKDIPLSIESITKTHPDPSRENSDYGISFKGQVDFSKISQFICFIDPINLDNKWKERFGFISEDYEMWYFNENNDMYFIGNEFWFRGTCLKLIEFVHQLQNLYFALVGEELVLQD